MRMCNSASGFVKTCSKVMPPSLRTLNYCNMIIVPYLLHIVRTDEHRQQARTQAMGPGARAPQLAVEL
ncbi:hypothetical protein DPMN_003541 [Dreissena polymorpha]|uniref:Uncharacterized protein n=1 Tax=Dreissena polymorpha TaxID=45954 RepID=A0A9D4MLR3_DREPO|nr:hypothetical protein DPMN_003541 [Dreissena polymorpha]